jgi:hypothetical protein
MGKVTDELIALIARQVNDKGIVVWYDPEQSYTEVAEKLRIANATVLRYEGSYFELRERLEPFLEAVDAKGHLKPEAAMPPRLVVYVPKAPHETSHALIEVESAGVVMGPEPDHWQLNTSLRVIAERVFKVIAPDHASSIAEKADRKRLSLVELDQIADQARDLGTGAVKLIFGTASAIDVTLKFAATTDKDSEIQSKQALPELLQLFELELGVKMAPGISLNDARRALHRTLLLADFVSHLPSQEIPKELATVSLPLQRGQIDTVRQICRSWRNRIDYKESYIEVARTVESEVGLEKFNLQPENLLEVETFSSIENRLLAHTEQDFLKNEPQTAITFASARKQSFWSLQEATNLLRWSLLETAANLVMAATRIKTELKSARKNPAEMIKAYTAGISPMSDGNNPWFLLDTHHRHLEKQYTTFDLEISGEHDLLEQVIYRARQKYMETVGLCAEAFTASLEAADFRINSVLRQEKIFPTLVAPLIQQAQTTQSKVAYLLVDAMRFEMGRELLDGLSSEFVVSLQPAVAQLPSITEVGMSVALPGADEAVELVEAGPGKVAIKIKGKVLKDRPARIKYLRSAVGATMVDLKLNDLVKPSKKLREEIAKASFVLVTSQEIDRRGEEAGDEDEARRYMDEVLDKLRKGIRRLATMGVAQMVITADHGHLFGEALESGLKIDAPGGKTTDLHRRVWIGKGGVTPTGCVRVSVNLLGLGGELEAVFPSGLACLPPEPVRRPIFTVLHHSKRSLFLRLSSAPNQKPRQQPLSLWLN